MMPRDSDRYCFSSLGNRLRIGMPGLATVNLERGSSFITLLYGFFTFSLHDMRRECLIPDSSNLMMINFETIVHE